MNKTYSISELSAIAKEIIAVSKNKTLLFYGEMGVGKTTLIKEICKEIMALTKMNFNNSDYCDGLPITLQFSKKVGEIIQYFPSDLTNPPNKYYYYM